MSKDEQPDLIDVPNDWDETWQGMPSYDHQNLMPWKTILVHLRNVDDWRAFAKHMGQQLNEKTKFIWFPEAKIQAAADKVFSAAKMTPRYPVYVISKGRADTRLTAKCFEWIKVPYHIVVEPQEYDQYAAVIDPKKILALPFSNLGLGGIPARNWVWEHAIATGAARHWIFDDNISGFCRFQDNLKVEVDSGVLHCAIEDFVDRYENVVMAGFNYDYFAPRKQGSKIRPYTLNTRIYSGILLSNMIPYRWRGRYNEDTDLSLRILKDGLCTVLFNAFLMYKKPTLTMKGGNSDELYAGVNVTAAEWELHAKQCGVCGTCVDGYASNLIPCEAGQQILSKDGRWLMAEHLREQHPDITTVERKWQRWQHQVDYRGFNQNLGRNVLRLREGVVLTDENKYEMTLGAMPPDEDGGPKPQGDSSLAPRKPSPRPEQKPEPPSRPGPAGPSALAFLARQPEPVAVSTSPPAASLGKPSLAEEKPATPEPGQPLPPPELVRTPTALELKASLAARGHRLLTRDGKFFVSESSQLTAEDRAAIKVLRDELIALATPWSEEVQRVPDELNTPVEGLQEDDNVRTDPEGSIPSPAPSVNDTGLVMPLRDAVPQQTLAQFLGTQPQVQQVDADWRVDEPPVLDGIKDVVLNFATNGLNWLAGDRPVGVTVSTLDGQLTRFLPFGFAGGNLDESVVKEWARRELRGKKITNSKTKFDVHMAREWGVDLEEQGCTFSDVQHTAALLDDHRKRFALDILAADYFPGEQLALRLDETQHHRFTAAQAAEREKATARLVGRLRDAMYPEVDKQELRKVQDLEDDVIPAVVEMEKNGSPIDMELLERYGKECNAARDALLWEVSKECGFAFEHTASGWKRLIESLHLAVPDSFSESVLDEVDHPLIRKGQRASQYASLNSKIFKAYPAHIVDGILRYNINQLASDEGGTVSGRFSIGIVQQVPNEYNHAAIFGEELYPRRLFIPGAGEYFEGDAAQIEFRLLVHYSENPKLLQAYRDDPWMSFHAKMQEMLMAYKPDMNYAHTKSYNFAAQYGARSIKLAIMMGFITEREGTEIRNAKRWDDPRLKLIKEIESAYQHAHPEAGALLERASHLMKNTCDQYCKQGDKLHKLYPHRGYIKTFLGRRSRCVNNYKPYIGLNRCLQGTGASVMKRKLTELHAVRKETCLVMRITNHDAVLGDALAPDTKTKVSEVLNRQSFPFKVPILWKCGSGPTWADCK